jgi:GNAT superfamily N-acetyltransferase
MLTACYRGWVTDPNTIALVALDPYAPIGLLIGSVNPQATRQHVTRTSRWALARTLLRLAATPTKLVSCWETYRAGGGSLPPIDDHPRTEVLVLAVHPQFQRMGIGRQLLNAFRHVLRVKGYPDRFGVVVGGSLHQAHAFYARNGGRAIATVRVHRHDPPSTFYLFASDKKGSAS